MTTNQRFVLDENDHVMDKLNPACKVEGHRFEEDPEDDNHLREVIVRKRLGDLVNDLIINLRPEQVDWEGKKYRPRNEEAHAIWWAIFNVVLASHLNTLSPAGSI